MTAPLPSRLDANQVLQGSFDEANGRLRTDSISTIVNADIDVSLDALEDNVAIRDSDGDELEINADGSINVVFAATDFDIRDLNASQDNIAISDGTDTLLINPDGSINVNIGTSALVLKNYYSEVTGIVMGLTTLVGTYTAIADVFLQKVQFSGTNIAEYELVIDGNTEDKQRTYFGNSLNGTFDFNNGLSVLTGSVIQVYVVHNRPVVGDFNARIQILES